MSFQQIDFKNELKKIKKPVWDKISSYLPFKDPSEHYKMVREYPERQGKYLRPGLVLFSAEMYGCAPEKAALTAAIMQTSEDWLLIHDDFEDHSLERRSTKEKHRPALHRLYGDELAVNAGDALHIIMWKMMGDNVRYLGDDSGWQIYYKMCDILAQTTEGQFIEINWIRNNILMLSPEDYYGMIYKKAGYYTITGPVQLGALVARTPVDQIKAIEEWGTPFGCAFQIWDDCMNLTVESEKQGKERGGDILEGKRTLILIHLLSRCSASERDRISAIYSKQREQKEEGEKEYILDLMEKYGSIDYAKKVAIEYAETAKSRFDVLTAHLPHSRARDIIRAGIDFTVTREV